MEDVIPQKQRNPQASGLKVTLHKDGEDAQGLPCLHQAPTLVHANQPQVEVQVDHRLVYMEGY